MKKVLVGYLALFMLVMGFVTGYLVRGKPPPAVKPDFEQLKLLSASKEQDRLGPLGIDFPDEGNAADIYIDFIKRDSPLVQESWINFTGRFKSQDPEDRKAVTRALESAGPQLDRLIQASRMKECNLWETYFKPDPKLGFFEQPTPNYMGLLGFRNLLVARGDRLAAAGDLEAAREHYRALIRMGQQLEQEPVTLGNMVAVALKKSGAQALADHYLARGQPEKAAPWILYEQVQEIRGRNYRPYSFLEADWDQELTEAFVMDQDVPYGLRLETLANKHFCLDHLRPKDKWEFYLCVAYGPPKWVDQLIDKFGAQDERSARFAGILKNQRVGRRDLQIIKTVP